jgi:MFS family permease
MAIDPAQYWRRNLYVCLFGSFTTLAAMTLLLPFLPAYVEELGGGSPQAVIQWSGVAFAITFFGAGLMAPVWGKVADRYGRKVVLVRASLCMAITMSLIGVAQSVGQLVALRLLAGLLGGYSSGAVVLVATQTPRERAGWALGTLSVGAMAGNLTGPLIGGLLPGLIGIRATFFLAGGVIFVAFVATLTLVREVPRVRAPLPPGSKAGTWAALPDWRPVVAMLATAMLLMFANMSIEPIISVYVGSLVPPGGNVTLISGVVMSASAFGSMLAASRLGRLADRVGAWTVVIGCLAATGLLLIPQAFVTAAWQLIVLRFLMGVALAGLLPSVNATIRLNAPDRVMGTVLGYAVSAQFAGQVAGPLVGGLIGAHVGLRAVFGVTSTLMLAGALGNWWVRRRHAR